MRSHTDYVKQLAYSKEKQQFVSCGLDSCVYLWDIEKTLACKDESNYFPTKIKLKNSVYTCSVNDEFTLLATGSTDQYVRLFDPRTQRKLFKLKGHSDNIHSVIMNSDGTKVVSSGSDKLIKIWDLRTQKCLMTYSQHDDTVFKVKFYKNDDMILSGGKDGNIYLTDTIKNESSLLVSMNSPILSVNIQNLTF